MCFSSPWCWWRWPVTLPNTCPWVEGGVDTPEVHLSCHHRDGGTCEEDPDGTGPMDCPSPQFWRPCKRRNMSQRTRWVVVVAEASSLPNDHRRGKGLPLCGRNSTCGQRKSSGRSCWLVKNVKFVTFKLTSTFFQINISSIVKIEITNTDRKRESLDSSFLFSGLLRNTPTTTTMWSLQRLIDD
jgi:hypothetical protein